MTESAPLVQDQDQDRKADEPVSGEGEFGTSGSRPGARTVRRPRRPGPGLFALVVMPSLVAVAGVSTLLALRGDQDSPGPFGGPGATDQVNGKVDGSYVPWLRRATRDCPVATPAVLAAQIDLLSGWNDDTASVSKQGIARFTDVQWKKWGRDDNGSGRASPHEPVDAIMALGRQDCSLLKEVTALRTRGSVHGDLVDLMLAAHTVGTDAVARAGHVPAAAREVLDGVKARLPQYESLVRQNPEASKSPVASALMAAPLRTPAVTSLFGTREHPLTGVTKLHTGVDFAGPQGTLVSAARAGRVEFAAVTPAYGARVVIHHGTIGGKRLETTYSHLTAIQVAPGQSVTAGSAIGRVGSTGLSTGPHLHFEVLLDGQYVDPMPWLTRTG